MLIVVVVLVVCLFWSEDVINCKRVSMSSLKCSEYVASLPFVFNSIDPFDLFFLFRCLILVVVVGADLWFSMKLLNFGLSDDVTIGGGFVTIDDNKGDDSFTLLLLLSNWHDDDKRVEFVLLVTESTGLYW